MIKKIDKRMKRIGGRRKKKRKNKKEKRCPLYRG